MTNIEIINLISSIASLLLAIVALYISLYFYNQSKNTESNINNLLTSIKTQTNALESLTGKYLDRFTKYATSSRPADETNILLIRTLESLSSSSYRVSPGIQQNTLNESTNLDPELISLNITTFYYAATTNIALQSNLPELEQVDDNDMVKNILDGSFQDVQNLYNYLSSLEKSFIENNRLFNLYSFTEINLKPYVSDSFGVIRNRCSQNNITTG